MFTDPPTIHSKPAFSIDRSHRESKQLNLDLTTQTQTLIENLAKRLVQVFIISMIAIELVSIGLYLFWVYKARWLSRDTQSAKVAVKLEQKPNPLQVVQIKLEEPIRDLSFGIIKRSNNQRSAWTKKKL